MAFNLEKPMSVPVSEYAEQETRRGPLAAKPANVQAKSVPYMTRMLEQIIRMTQKSLNTSAASILLFRDNDQELYFEAASGPVGKTLRQVKLSTKYGIAGQVARTGKPLIVNDVNRSEKFHKMIDDTTGFSTESLICAPLSVKNKILGVIEILNKLDGTEFNEQDLEAAVSVASTAAMAIEHTRMRQMILDTYKSTLMMMAEAIDNKIPNKSGHSQRVMEFAMLAGTHLSLSSDEMEALEYASILHDVGKISIDDSIVAKTGYLTLAEEEKMRKHPAAGAALLKEIPFLEKASELVLHHHEKYDGSGYPDGLKGDEIPMGARIIAVADAFDNMTSEHSERPVMSIDDSINQLNKHSGTRYCPLAIRALLYGVRIYANG
jgi:HD-GYP domain-containing protein (c-di-GMP phosphodiesterase class II)